MKSTIIALFPAIVLLGCTSTASQARPEVSTGEKANEIEKVESPDVSSSHTVEALAEALDAMLAPVAEVIEQHEATLDAPHDTAIATSDAATSSSATATTSASSTPTTAAPSSDTETSPVSPETADEEDVDDDDTEGEDADGEDADDESESSPSSETIRPAPSKAPVTRVASIAKIVSNALSNVGLISRAQESAVSDASAASSDTSSASEAEAAESDEAAPAASATVAPRDPATTAEVLQAVSQLRGLAGWTIIPFAHFRRGDRHAVIAWPAINSAGRLVDATVVGICLEETAAGELEECGRRWVVREAAASRSATVEALGGSDYEVVGRSSGVALDDLGPRLASLGTEFSRAVAARNSAGARQAAMATTRLLPLDSIAYENGVARLLYAAASYNGSLEHVSTERSGDSATLVFHVRRGILRLQTITATARPVNGNTDRWIITSYR